MPPVTLKDIAAKLDLSITTVSRALAGYGDVAEATRVRVLKAAKEMGYVPDVTARRLQKGRTDTIGFVIPTFGPRFSDPFFSELLSGIGNEAARHEFDLLVSTRSPDSPEEDAAYQHLVEGRRVDGLLLVRTRVEDRRIAYLTKEHFPFVAYGRSTMDVDFCYLDVDGTLGLELATRHLLDLGHRRIAFISPPEYLMFTVHRRTGLENMLRRSGLSLPPEYHIVDKLTSEGGFEAMNQLLDLPHPPTAVVAGNDMLALGAISAAQARSLVVGRDVSVVGFDDIPLAQHAHPTLTTVRQPIYEIGCQIADLLIRSIKGEAVTKRQILLKPQLIVRESSGVVQDRPSGD